MLVVVASGANAQPPVSHTHSGHAMNQIDGHCGTKYHQQGSHQPGQHCLCLACVPVIMQPVVALHRAQGTQAFGLFVMAAMTDLATGPQPPPPRI